MIIKFKKSGKRVNTNFVSSYGPYIKYEDYSRPGKITVNYIGDSYEDIEVDNVEVALKMIDESIAATHNVVEI